MNITGCLKEQSVNEYFSESFLNNDLLKILPDGYDVCYKIKIYDDEMLSVVFYLYDSGSPMNEIDPDYIVGSISIYVDQGEDDEINISSLSVNETLNEFNLRKAGFGSYLMFIAICYAKSLDIQNIKLDDMSDGYRSENNIYKRIGLEYEDENSGPEMFGLIDEVYSNLDGFLKKYSSKIINKLDELTEYFYDEEWLEEEWSDDEDDEEYEEMEMDGGENGITTIKGCISNTQPSEYFPESFLNNPLFKLLPEGYDICYELLLDEDINMIAPVFYLYDSTSPLEKFKYDHVIGSIFIHFNKPLYGWHGWTPWNNMAHIPELVTNSDLDGFDLRRAGIGTFLILCSIAYAKSFGINIVTLYDASSGFRTEHNIYKKLGFQYVDNIGHDMVGDINVIYSRLSVFIDLKGELFSKKLNELTEYFDDEEWLEDEEMEMDGGVGTPPDERAIEARDRWLSDMRRRFQESIQSGQPDMELAQTIMRNTPIDQTQVRAIPMSGVELRRQERRQRRTLGRNTRPPLSEQTVLPPQYTNRVPVARLVPPGEDVSHLQMMQVELVPRRDSIDSAPDSPDKNQMKREAARDIQRRFRGNRQRRKLTKSRPRYGKMVEPATDREQIRRWMDLSNQFDQDDPVKGYLNPFTKKGGKKTMKKKRKMRGGMGDNEEISLLKNKLEECENKNEICCGDMDKAAENIQRVTRGHQGRNTFKQKRRSMKPNVTDTLLDMPTDFGSMIMDKIPEAREEQKKDKQINLLRRYIGELVSELDYREAGANKTDADILGEVAEMAADRDLDDQNTHTDLEYLSWLKKLRETNRVYIPLYLKNIENMKEVIKRRNLQEIIKVITHAEDDADEFDNISQQLANWPGADAGRVLAYAKIKMSLFDEWWSSDREDSWTHMVNQYFSRDVLPRYV